MDFPKALNKKKNYLQTGMNCAIFFLVDAMVKIIVFASDNYQLNENIFWGIASISNEIIVIISIIILFYILYHCWISQLQKFTWCLILIGGVSNTIDRILFEGVIDYIYLEGLTTFNLADIYICIGLVLLIIQIIYAKENRSTK